MNTIEEACDKIKEYLTDWYVKNKDIRARVYKNDYPHLSYAKHLNGNDLHEAKQKFIKSNPEYKKYDFDIYVGFDVDSNTWKSGCLDGCCITRVKVRGIYSTIVDWDYTRSLAFRKSKTNQNPKDVRESLEKTEDLIKELNGTTKVY